MCDKKLDKNFFLNVDKAVQKTLVPKFSTNTVRPCAKEDFDDYQKSLSENINCVLKLLDTVIEMQDLLFDEKRVHLIRVMVIVGEQHCKCVWNSNDIVELSKQLSIKICKIFEKQTISELLSDEKIFSSLIMFLRPKLLKDTWKCYPSAVICYKWILNSIEKPLLKRHVTEILPTALIILDDYVKENQKTGLMCLDIILQHCHFTRSLRNHNYDEVIFEALQKMAHKVESNLITDLYSCISKLLENIQYCSKFDNPKGSFSWSKQDEVLSVILSNMELQSNWVCRKAYTESLSRLLTHSSIGRWTERITRILSDYIEDYTNLEVSNASLDLLKKFLSVYQPKDNHFYAQMHVSLIKLRGNLCASKDNEKETIKTAYDCTLLLIKLNSALGDELMKNETVKELLFET